jgi:DNA-binding beta-propeller fold protein YncE
LSFAVRVSVLFVSGLTLSLTGCPNMQEYNVTLEEPIQRGLRADERVPHNTPRLEVMQNLKPTAFGGVTPDTITFPVPNLVEAITFPFPQIFRGDASTYMLSRQTAYTVTESSWAVSAAATWDAAIQTNTKAITAGGVWQAEVWQSVMMATNGESFVFNLPSNTGTKILTQNTLTIQALGRHDNRIVFGGMDGVWFDGARWTAIYNAWRETLEMDQYADESMEMAENYVFWSERGGGADDIPFHVALSALGMFGTVDHDKWVPLIMERIEANEIGITPLRVPGTIQAIKQLGNDIIVYTTKGISILRPFENNYREEVLLTVGVKSRSAVNGDKFEHVFIDPEDNLWRVVDGTMPTQLGYSEYLGEEAPLVYQATFSAVTRADSMYLYNNELYITSDWNNKLEVRSLSGVLARWWAITDAVGVFVSSDEVYVTSGEDKIYVYNLTGVLQRTWGSSGSGDGEFNDPRGIVVEGGFVYVADRLNNRIQKFTAAGVYMAQWAVTNPLEITSDGTSLFVLGVGLTDNIYRFSYTGTLEVEWLIDLSGLSPSQICPVTDGIMVVLWGGGLARNFVTLDSVGTVVRTKLAAGISNSVVAFYTDGVTAYVHEYGPGNVFVYGLGPANMVISFDPSERDFWIANNESCHILTPSGLGGPMDYLPTCLLRDPTDALVGVFLDLGTDLITIRTVPITLSRRDYKHMVSYTADSEGITAMSGRMVWRMNVGAAYANGPWRPFNEAGVAYVNTSFIDGKVEIKGTWTDESARLERIDLRYQAEGRKSIRGTAGQPGDL